MKNIEGKTMLSETKFPPVFVVLYVPQWVASFSVFPSKLCSIGQSDIE